MPGICNKCDNQLRHVTRHGVEMYICKDCLEAEAVRDYRDMAAEA